MAKASRALRSEKELCAAAEWIVIGKVARSSSYRDDTSLGNIILTRLRVKVERIAHGDPPPFVDLIVMGGTIGGKSLVVSGQPKSELGSRHLLLISRGPGSSELMGDTGLLHMFRMDAEAELPTDVELRQIWNEHCTETRPAPGLPRPSEPYMPFLPSAWRNICRHYSGEPEPAERGSAPAGTRE